jgi:hypothetical protein
MVDLRPLIVKFPQTISSSDSVAMVRCRWLNAEKWCKLPPCGWTSVAVDGKIQHSESAGALAGELLAGELLVGELKD